MDYSLIMIKPDITVRSAMRTMSDIGRKELFVVNGDKKLEGVLSDGDIRKWILCGGILEAPIGSVCNRSPKSVGEAYDIKDAKKIMLDYRIESVPVLDEHGCIVDILFWDAVLGENYQKPVEAVDLPVVLMAGGMGTRLDPFTKILPKPLIPIGEKPIIELIMDRLRAHGMRCFYLILNYKAAMIRAYLEEANLDYELNFLEEPEFLGTVGGLKLLPEELPDTFLLTNCDVIIDAEYADILHFHKDNTFDLTIIVSCHHFRIPYGVCDIENGGVLKNIREKPEYDFLVNTGVYLMNKKLITLLPAGRPCQINELIDLARGKGLRIGTYPIQEKRWIDIGQWDEFHKAVKLLGV